MFLSDICHSGKNNITQIISTKLHNGSVDIIQLVECVSPTKFGVPSSAPHNPSIVLDICNSSNQEIVAEGSGVQGPPCLYRKFEVNLGYVIPCLKTNK